MRSRDGQATGRRPWRWQPAPSDPWVPSLRTIATVALLGGFAAALRFLERDGAPVGMHGDEAVVGLEAQRILENGWIGLYSPFAAGQPAAPIYFWAPAVGLLGNSIFAVRFVPALVGSGTVVLVFLMLRRNLGFAGAAGAALLLAGMAWHVHYSRIAFPLIFWPLVVLTAQWAIVRAFEQGQRRWWFAAGALAASGVYIYNAHWMFGVAVALAGAGFLALEGRSHLRRHATGAAVACVGAIVTLLPIAWMAVAPGGVYTRHFRREALIGSELWRAHDSLADRAELLVGRYFDVWEVLLGAGHADNVDASGLIAMVSVPLLLLACWGLATGWQNWRWRWWWLSSVAILLVMPLSSVFTIGGVARRSFAMSIPLVVLAGIAIADIETWLGPALERLHTRRLFAPATLAISGLIGVFGMQAYFTTFSDNAYQRWVFLEDFTAASLFMAELPEDVEVVVASYRHSVDYETREFLAPEADGEDWAFRKNVEFDARLVREPTVVVLVGPEQKRSDELEEVGGRPIVTAGETGGLYTVYCLRCPAPTYVEVAEAGS